MSLDAWGDYDDVAYCPEPDFDYEPLDDVDCAPVGYNAQDIENEWEEGYKAGVADMEAEFAAFDDYDDVVYEVTVRAPQGHGKITVTIGRDL